MKKIFLFIFNMLTFSSLISFSQNLVPNFSFEQTDTCDIYGPCPTGFSMICIANGWTEAKGSPDYFNACDSGIVAVPQNAFGYQNAATGNAYAGFFTYIGTYNTNEREWIQCTLNNQLIIGGKYSISFKISLADSINCATNNIGVLFSTVSQWYNVYVPQPNYSHFKTNTVFADTSNWTFVTGEFIADSAYQYMLIGNFYDYSLTDSIFFPSRPVMNNLDSSRCFAYYYIDDISLIADTSNDILEEELKYKISIFPNPTDNKIIIKSEDSYEANILIYNSIGQTVFSTKIFHQVFEIDLSTYTKGIYLIQISHDNLGHNTKTFKQKLIITN